MMSIIWSSGTTFGEMFQQHQFSHFQVQEDQADWNKALDLFLFVPFVVIFILDLCEGRSLRLEGWKLEGIHSVEVLSEPSVSRSGQREIMTSDLRKRAQELCISTFVVLCS
jgi:hypothetical protein